MSDRIQEYRESLIRFIQEDLLSRSSITVREGDSLFRSGLLDSFSFARLNMFLEERFGVSLADGGVSPDEIDTVDDLLELIAARTGN